MKYDNSEKLYQHVGESRLLNITVYLDDVEVYTGMVENAPQEVKRLKYSHIETSGKKYEYYTYSKFNS